MAVESKRGCGYRKVGGIYLVSDEKGRRCGLLPLALTICPTCSAGIKQTRGWTWIDPVKLFADAECVTEDACGMCPAMNFEHMGPSGLLWIGAQFYKTPEHFTQEAANQGISRRISTIPRGFVLGETWVFLAHPDITEAWTQRERFLGREVELDEQQKIAGVFRIFRPTRIEQIVNESDLDDDEFIESLTKRNITPVAVPDDDPDHH